MICGCSSQVAMLDVYAAITAGTLVPRSVNGDIAIQWKWSNFDPSQNPNLLTDYGNFPQLITSTRRTRNPKFVPIGCKGAPGEILFFIFFPTTPPLK